MRWDLGLQGIALLGGMSLAFGIIAQLIVRPSTRWLWLFAAGGYFVLGALVSEVWFGWATAEELQPNIDGLSFDEVLLLATLPGLLVIFVARRLTRKKRRRLAGRTA